MSNLSRRGMEWKREYRSRIQNQKRGGRVQYSQKTKFRVQAFMSKKKS